MNEKKFIETQKLKQWWLWLLILASAIFSIYTIIKPVLNNDSTSHGNLSFSIIMPAHFWIVVLLTFIILLLLFFMKMTTVVSADKITIKHMYVVNKDIFMKDIASANIITYGFLGYGKRYSSKHGIVYNIRGNKGLAITLKSGKKYLISTQKPNELEKVINSVL